MKHRKNALYRILIALERRVEEGKTGLSFLNPELRNYLEVMGKDSTIIRYAENHDHLSDDRAEELFAAFFDAVANAAMSGEKDKSITMQSRAILLQLGLDDLVPYVDDFIAERTVTKHLRVS